jgi:DNA-binding XRE family transcriptional regulator
VTLRPACWAPTPPTATRPGTRGSSSCCSGGVHHQTVGYLERGEFSPSLHLALRIAEYVEVPVEVVFSTTPFPRLGTWLFSKERGFE